MTGTSFTSDDGAAWLTVTPVSVDASGLGTYRATVDRSGLANGLYTGTIHFTSDHNDVDVAVIMHVGNPGGARANAGHHYILLVNPGTRKIVGGARGRRRRMAPTHSTSLRRLRATIW